MAETLGSVSKTTSEAYSVSVEGATWTMTIEQGIEIGPADPIAEQRSVEGAEGDSRDG